MTSGGCRIVGYVDRPEGELGDADASRLRAAGVDAVINESDPNKRPVLLDLAEELGKNDVLMVVAMDRLGRPVPKLLRRVISLHERGVCLRCLEGGVAIDGSRAGSAQGRVIKALMECYNAWESSKVRDRGSTMRKRGTRPGANPKLAVIPMDRLLTLLGQPGASQTSVARQLGVGRTTLYRHLKRVPAPR